jgi:hypothetical protein
LTTIITIGMELNCDESWRVIPFKKIKTLQANHDDFVDVVEVAWNGKIERVVFTLPVMHRFWKMSSRLKFLETVDLSSVEKRMGQLFAGIDG